MRNPIGAAPDKRYRQPMKHVAENLILFLVLLSTAPALSAAPDTGNAPQTNSEPVSIRVDPETVRGRISPGFIGFGYETSAVAQTNYFSAENKTLVQLYRNLGTQGLIRIGGNVSDHTEYLPAGQPRVRTEKEVTVINQACLVRLAGFVKATGWKVMWGLNLGTGSKAAAVREAVAVDQALKDQLQSFQIGNEVELLPRFGHVYENYHAAYLDYKQAIRAVLPQAPFSGPDSVGHWNWITNFMNAESGDLKLLTHHYYREGAKDPTASLAKLLSPDAEWTRRLGQLQQLCGDHAVPFRINEVNSFWGGGKKGVSDTFGSALWCLDYMFQLSTYGCNGVNMETDINQLGWISHYSPIVHDPSGSCRARPEYYGMLAFALSGKGELLKVSRNKTTANATVYATRNDDGQIWVIMINKDLSRDITAEISLPESYSRATVFRLEAPSVESKDQVTLAGSAVAADGTWPGGSPEPISAQNGTFSVSVPRASAILLRL
jgi:hypothetical protein